MNAARLNNHGLSILVSILSSSSAYAIVTIDYVSIGNAGNAPDPLTGYGAVENAYQIAKNETTIGQYTEFLNAVAKSDPYSLYSDYMATFTWVAGISRSGVTGSFSYSVIGSSVNKPITLVSWFDAARFCNWMHNGQGNGSTETGAYTLNGAMSGIYNKNPGAVVWIPSEDEWYKAAYFDPTKESGGGYWTYPTQSNAIAGNSIGVPDSANYYDGDYVGWPNAALTNVGAYGPNSASYYGTNDQAGNVWEWTDSKNESTCGLRGGSWGSYEESLTPLAHDYNGGTDPSYTNNAVGFRVAGIPEPTSIVLTMLASGVLMTRRKR